MSQQAHPPPRHQVLPAAPLLPDAFSCMHHGVLLLIYCQHKPTAAATGAAATSSCQLTHRWVQLVRQALKVDGGC
jgi:hypothetical protein